MSTPIWEAGHLYLKGDLVQPVQAVGGDAVAITNPGFESGDTAWTKGTGWVITNAGGASKYAGSYSAEFQGAFAGPSVISMATAAACSPGQSITAKVKVNTGGNGVNDAGAAIRLIWLDAADVQLKVDEGNICRGGGNAWFESGVTATAPANAAKVAVGVNAYRNDGMDALWIDNFTWNHLTPTAQEGLIYKAVQDDPGYSDSVEPAWPTTLGVQVIDNEVIWEAVLASRVTYEARPILKSGTTEPTWPTTPGAFVVDGTISWECVSRRVEDENCPNTKVVHILAGKVFAVDRDIIRFCATANPLDWSTPEDAGFLPSGLRSANANDMAVLHQYRGNLAAFNASSFQNWQADPDPAAMAILDQIDGIGSTWPKAAQAVANDLLFLSQRGVRSVGIAAGAENLAAGDIGIPIDAMVQESLRVATANSTAVLSTHYPGAGQYWLVFPDYPPPALGVSGSMPDAYVGDATTGAYTAVGGVAPYTYAATPGTFPPGVTLSSDGTWSGTHEGNGNGNAFWDFAPEVTVTDADGETASFIDSVRVTNFSISGNLTGGYVGQSTSGSYTNTHGFGAITYAVLSGTFPAGATLGTNGTCTGTFTTASTPSWVVQATDAAGNTTTLNDSASILDTDFWIAELGHAGATDYVYKIDGTTGASSGPILIQDVPGDQMAMTPDFAQLMIPNTQSDSVSFISVANSSVTNVSVGDAPNGIACDATHYYLTHSTSKTIVKRLRADNSIVATSAAMTFTPDECQLTAAGDRLLVTTVSNVEIYVLDTDDLSVIQTITASGSASGLKIHPDDSRAYFQNGLTEKVNVIDLTTYAISVWAGIDQVVSYGIVPSPDGQWVYVMRDNEIYRVTPSTGGAALWIDNMTGGNYAFDINSAGTRFYVSCNRSGGVVDICDIASQAVTSTVSLGVYGGALCARPLP